MGDQLRVAIAGTGFIGRVHAHAVRVAGARLVAVAASSPESAERAARALGAERAEASAEAMAAADDIDVLHICTPNHLHEPLALAALASGKHVVCEKPLALDAAGAARMEAAATAAGRVLAVPYVYRFHPTVRHARAMIAAGDIGPIRLLHGSYQQDWLASPDDDSWRVDPNVGGRSRAFADIGSHWCDLVEFASGHRISRVLARTATVVPERAIGSGPAFSPGAGADQVRRPVETEDVALVALRDRPGRGRVGGRQPGVARAQEPAVVRARRRRRRGRVRPGAAGAAGGRPPDGPDHPLPRPGDDGARRRPPGDDAGGARPGLPGLLQPVRGRRLRGHRRRRRRRGFRRGPTACGPPASSTPCSPLPRARRGRRSAR